MRTPPLLADFIHHRVCKPICEKLLTLFFFLLLQKLPDIQHCPGREKMLNFLHLFQFILRAVDQAQQPADGFVPLYQVFPQLAYSPRKTFGSSARKESYL